MHYVVSTEDAIVYGRHFYSTSSIARSVSGIVHTFILGYFITNDSHTHTRTLIRRLIYLWLKYYSVEEKDRNNCKSSCLACTSIYYNTEISALDCHVPDLTTQHGFNSMMAVGNLLELGHALDRRFYEGTLSKKCMEEHNVARLNYRLLQKIFTQRYSVMVDDQLVSPMAIFKRSLMTFAGSVVVYKYRGYDEQVDGRACTPQKLHNEVAKIIALHFPESAWDFEYQSRKPLYMHWIGRSMHIRARLPSDRAAESSELEEDYNGDQHDDGDEDDDDDDDESSSDGKKDPQPSTSANSSITAPMPDDISRKRQRSGEFI